MWYQSVIVTQLIIILAFAAALYALIYLADKRWITFSLLTITLVSLAVSSLFFDTKYRQKIDKFKLIKYEFKEIKDLSDFEADKYAVTVVTEPNLSKAQTKEVIEKATKQVQKERKDARIIWVAVFNNYNANFKKLDDDNPGFVGQSQWKRSGYQGLLPESFISNDNHNEIKIYFSSKDSS